MAIRRPALSEESFLKHLFSPAKNPLPTGLRARKLVATPGRSKARVAAYNRMSAKNQEILRRSGMRESYLKGDASITEAKKALRGQAVEKGFAKRLKGAIKRTVTARRRSLDEFVASRIVRGLRDKGKEPNVATIVRNVEYLPDDVYDRANTLTGDDIIRYATDSGNVITVDNRTFNPLWYH